MLCINQFDLNVEMRLPFVFLIDQPTPFSNDFIKINLTFIAVVTSYGTLKQQTIPLTIR